jgi:hypothetical protein
MTIVDRPVPVHTVGTNALIEELWQRDDLDLALKEFRRRNAARAAIQQVHWWSRFRLGPRVWGLSGSWFAFCFWNGDTAWITLPFVYFGVGTKNIELGLGKGKWHVTFDIRWRWE